MSITMGTFQELFEGSREREWQHAGVPQSDILFSRLCGIGAPDVQTFREISQGGWMFITRCPRLTARPWHGLMPAKPWHAKAKTGSSGVGATKSGMLFVSDYDLMSVWRRSKSGGFEKVFISAAGGEARGKWTPEARAIIRELNRKGEKNRRLDSRIQHGCQDDFHNSKNRGVEPDDQFAAFCLGQPKHLPSPAACETYYITKGLPWPYTHTGRHIWA